MSAPRIASSAFIGTAWFAALLAACMVAEDWPRLSSAMGPGTRSTRSFPPHAPQESVERRPVSGLEALLKSRSGAAGRLHAEDVSEAPAPEPVPTATARPVGPTSQPELQQPSPPRANSTPPASPPTREPAPPALPVLPPAEPHPVPAELKLRMDRPATVVEHEPALFVVRLSNPGPDTADGVTLHADFDEGWEFAGSDELSITQRIGVLEMGSTRDVPLSLTPLRAGRGRIEFRVESDSHRTAAESVAIDVQRRQIELGLAGPPQRALGQRAEYVVTVVNTSGRDLPEARANVEYDPLVLAVREASVGWVAGPGTLSWPLGALLRDERVQIQLEFECLAEALQTHVRCSFLSADQIAVQRAAPLKILPAAGVDVTIVDEDDPRSVGDQVRFTVRVRNRTQAPLQDLELRLTTSPHFDSLALADDARSAGATIARDAYGIDLRGLRVPLGGEVRVTAAARAAIAGNGALRVLVRATGLPAPFEVEESLLVNPALAAD